MREYIKRFLNLSLICPTGMPLPMLLHTYRHNFLDKVKIRMGAVKAHVWKDLVKQAEITKNRLRSLNPPYPRKNGGSTPRGVMQPNFSNQKGKKPWPLSY